MRHATRCASAGRRCLGLLLGLGMAATPAGCGTSGVGSVDFDQNPDARSIGAAPKPRTGRTPQPPPVRPPKQKHREYNPS